jgi:hypothetical protein
MSSELYHLNNAVSCRRNVDVDVDIDEVRKKHKRAEEV